MTDITPGVAVTVRYFAAAREAAGTDSVVLALKSGATVEEAIREICGQSDKMTSVLLKCSFLADGVAVRDRNTVLRGDQTLDVLPPFAGG